MLPRLPAIVPVLTFSCVTLLAQGVPLLAAVDFNKEIRPIIESTCLSCHQVESAEGDLRLDTLAAATAPGVRGAAIVPRDPAKSPFYTRLVLPEGHEQIMPPDGPPLDESQIARVKKWIEEGAPWPREAQLQVRPRIDFAEQVQPILETHCVSCHTSENAEGDLDMSTRAAAFTTGTNPPSIVPFYPDKSAVYTLAIVDQDDARLMPPADQGGPLENESIETIRLWISQGSIWPTNANLKPRTKKPSGGESPDNIDLVRRIHAKIVEQTIAEGEGKFVDYTGKIPKTGVPYKMVAIAGGQFLLGSPDTEPGRRRNEGPPSRVKVSPFWLGKYEVTWDEFEPFMITTIERFKNGVRKDFDPAVHTDVDAVSGPTAPYADMSFGMGRLGYPAICMTQHAANKYCQWLSAQTGHFYRLPTEAEWEYACRAGTTSAYSFGEDPVELSDYGWYIDNSEEKSQKVGQKKPNAWGLHDMHGNVMEWTADQFVPDYFERIRGGAVNPYVRPETLYPRTARGGSWNDDPDMLRSAFRLGSEAIWQQQDPQLPKSVWYLTDAPWLGFRILRPQEVPSAEEMDMYWNSSTGKY
jgi:formylglycine-generating enzyme required for sulfatase activity